MDKQPVRDAEELVKGSAANLFSGEFPQKQMERFAQQTPLNALVTFVIVLLATFILLPVAPLLQVLGWAILQGGLLSFVFFRWWTRRRIPGLSRIDARPSRRAIRHGLIFAGLSGGLWGALTVLMPGLPETHKVGVFLVQGGMAAGAAATLAAMPGAAFLFILGCMLPSIFYLLSYGQMPFLGLGLMLITFTLAMLGTTRLLFQSMLDQQTVERGHERALRENAANLQRFERAREEWLAVAGAGPGFALFDQADSLLVWNDKFCDVLLLPRRSLQRGRTRSAVLVDAARPLDSLPGSEGGNTWYDRLLHLKETDGILSAELPDGRLVEVNVGSMEGGYQVMIARDVTERQQAENSLRYSEARLRSTQRVARIGSWIRELKTGELQWSDEFYHMIGAEPGSVAPDSDFFERLVHEDDIEALRDAAAKGLLGQEQAEIEFRLYRLDGDMRHIRARGELILDQEGQPSLAMATFQDISDLRRAQNELAHAQKLEAVGQLTGGISHDFNNLLSVVIGNIELVEDNINAAEIDREKALSLLGRAQEAADRGSALTERLLAFSRKQELRPVLLDVNNLLRGMSRLLLRAVGETIEIDADLDPAALTVLADPSQLENAILNLCLNARDAMPEGGSLTIKSSLVGADALDPALALRVMDHVAISVIDSGSGISAEVRERVFEPFFTTKEVGRGSGLGLSMVYGFARQSGGDVQIESKERKGTKVAIYLPAVEGEFVRDVSRDAGQDGLASGTEKILVIEDNTALRELAEQVLTGLGYGVLLAEDGPSAIELVNAGAKFDLLFTDIVLPKGMDGVEVANIISKSRPGLKVLYTSGYTREAMTRHDLQEGAELLIKPYRRAQVAAMIRKVLDR